jgi:hypothetical protein
MKLTAEQKEDLFKEFFDDYEKRSTIEQEKAFRNQRAASITVGTCFGGSTEVSMRNNAGTNLHVILQPVEVIELVNQLTASVGCHIAIQPRADFASWREWNDETMLLEKQEKLLALRQDVNKLQQDKINEQLQLQDESKKHDSYRETGKSAVPGMNGWPPFSNDLWEGGNNIGVLPDFHPTGGLEDTNEDTAEVSSKKKNSTTINKTKDTKQSSSKKGE